MKGLEILLFFMVTDDNFLPCPTLHSIAILILLHPPNSAVSSSCGSLKSRTSDLIAPS